MSRADSSYAVYMNEFTEDKMKVSVRRFRKDVFKPFDTVNIRIGTNEVSFFLVEGGAEEFGGLVSEAIKKAEVPA